MPELLLTSVKRRPWVRAYTVLAFRPGTAELDVMFAIHGAESPASCFALTARVGEHVGIFDEGSRFASPPPSSKVLYVGDASALPAILSILNKSDYSLAAKVVLEVPTREDVLDILPRSMDVTWLTGTATEPGAHALDFATTLDLEGINRAWVAGESRLAIGVRRFLVRESKLAPKDISFSGYWRKGISSPG